MDAGTLFLTALAGAAGAFWGAYLKRKGEQLATKEDFDKVLDQVKETTRETAQINEMVKAQYGDEAARRSTLRDRLEKLMAATYDLELWLEEQRGKATKGDVFTVSSIGMHQVRTLQALYFPALEDQASDLQLKVLHEQAWIAKLMGAMIKKDMDAAGQVNAGFEVVHRPFIESLAAFRRAIVGIAKERLHV